MNIQKNNPVDVSISHFEEQYKHLGMRAQRSYPNESLIQFIASRFFSLPYEKRKNVKILEVGCGSGANLWMMAKEGFHVYGLDSSETALELARAHLSEKWDVSAEFAKGSFTNLPYDNDMFDAVVDVVSLQHLTIADARNALTEIARVLKPGGEFFSYRLSDHSIMYSQGCSKGLDAATLSNIDNPAMPMANNGPIAFWSHSLARMLYEDAHLQLVTVERVGRTYSNGAYVEYLSFVATTAD